jgi:hypothetical protein
VQNAGKKRRTRKENFHVEVAEENQQVMCEQPTTQRKAESHGHF